jgi:acyl-CoA synthetase (NDP forming)
MNIVKYLNSVGVPAFNTAEGCAMALSAMRTDSVAKPELAVSRLARSSGRALNEAEALALFAEHGIRIARHVVAGSPEEAGRTARWLGVEPVVVKMLSRSVAHKSDVGGVRVGVAIADVEATCRQMAMLLRDVDFDGWLIQEQVAGGTEMLLGMIRDAQLGAAVVLGAGGIATAVFGDSALRLLPLRESDPPEMLAELRSHVLLEGFRGAPAGDVEALFETVRQFSRMVEALGDKLLEAEINPLFVLPRGKGVLAADALVVFE